MVKQEEDTEKESGAAAMGETLGVRRLIDHEEESANPPGTSRPMGTARREEDTGVTNLGRWG